VAGDEHPELRELQAAGMDAMQQENLQLLSKRIGNLSIPVPLLGPVAAYALFADRLLGKTAMRYRIGLPACWTSAPSCSPSSTRCRPSAAHDRELVDAWAGAIGMTGWYTWIPYKP
jgi:hypothetical protein